MRPCRQYRSFAGCAWAAGDATATRAANDARVRMMRRISISFESGWTGTSASWARLRHVMPILVSAECRAFATWHIMTQLAASSVIYATVRGGGPGLSWPTCARRSWRTRLVSFGSGILEVLMQRSYLLAATAALALFMQIPLALAQSAPAGGTAAPAATTT